MSTFIILPPTLSLEGEGGANVGDLRQVGPLEARVAAVHQKDAGIVGEA